MQRLTGSPGSGARTSPFSTTSSCGSARTSSRATSASEPRAPRTPPPAERRAGPSGRGARPGLLARRRLDASDPRRAAHGRRRGKALGFNLARKHVKVEDPRWYAWCDRLGLLVAQDLPSSHDLSTAGARTQLAAEWREILGQLSGHPSIALWIPVNEDWGEPPPDFQRALVADARAAAPGRLVVDASGWKQLEDTDLVDVHDYGTELTKHVGKRDDIPLWFGELGGLSVGTGDFVYRHVADLAAGYRGVVEQVPEDVAGFVWTQLTDVEGEQNGLLTHERRFKCDSAPIRAVHEAFLRA